MKESFLKIKRKIGRKFVGLQEIDVKLQTEESIKDILILKYFKF